MSGKEKTNGSLAMAPRVITIPAASQENTRKLRVAAYARTERLLLQAHHRQPRLGTGRHLRRSGHHRHIHRQAG